MSAIEVVSGASAAAAIAATFWPAVRQWRAVPANRAVRRTELGAVAHGFEVRVRRPGNDVVMTFTGAALANSADKELTTLLARELNLSASQAAGVVRNLRAASAPEARRQTPGEQGQVGATAGERPMSPNTRLFDRRLPAAAAAEESRVAREVITSTDESLTIEMISASRREVELKAAVGHGQTGRLAAIRVETGTGPTTFLVPLEQGTGSVILVTSSPAVVVDREVELLGIEELRDRPASEIVRSVLAATPPTSQWWRSFAADVEAGNVNLDRAISAIIREALER